MSFLDKLRAKLSPDSQDPDLRLRAVLLDQGDDGTKPRVVDHLACFNNQRDADDYMAFILEEGYGVGDADEEYCVAFSRESAVAGEEFDQELAKLRLKATEMNGQYDGWGCSVVLP